MNPLQKVLMVLMLAILAAKGVHEARQLRQWRGRVREIQAEQASIADQIKQLGAERDGVTNRVAALLAAQAKAAAEAAELARLRAEESRLKAVMGPVPNGDVADQDVEDWLTQVGKLKRYVSEHPEENIPEMQFLTDREWLLMAATPKSKWEDSKQALEELKGQAETRFAEPVKQALQAYAAANDGKFPTDVSQLRPFCDADVEGILQERYEIKPGSILPADSVKTILGKKPDWVIAGKYRANAGSADRVAIFADGYRYFW